MSPNPMSDQRLNYLDQKQPVNSISQNSYVRISNFIRNNLIGIITATITSSLLITGVSTINIWNIYSNYESTISKQFKLQKSTDDLKYTDEYFTMLVRMLVSTGDLQWEDRYKKLMPVADTIMNQFKANITPELLTESKKTDTLAAKLFAIEERAIKLVRQGKKAEAYQVLMSEEYTTHKKIYSDANAIILAKIEKSIQAELADYQQQLLASIVFAGATLPLLIGSWIIVLLAVRDYIRDRQTTEASLIASQSNLIEANTLVEELGVRALYEEEVRVESELLQGDIAQLLEVVCAIEAGDLTVQANVSERVTGLVSDTLNRSIESLDRIITVVVKTARTVSKDANQLEQTTIETASQAQAQNTEVRSVQSLMNTINSLTADSRQQAIETDVAMKLAQSAVIAGQQAINDTTEGIETLQSGTNRIVKRTELLTEFVELAAQFSKDQKRVAALTRVLALNASTISARAMKEQNPEQFASLAKEFDIIARQVSTLATDTNLSLLTLQQRTDRVQTVTSGLTQDITEIEQLVAKFTTEVNKSRTAFGNIQTVTNQVSQIGEKVNESSQDIVRVVNDTLIAVQSIARAAQSTEASSTITREQVQSMGNLARKLLEMVEFFKLTEVYHSGDLSLELQQLVR